MHLITAIIMSIIGTIIIVSCDIPERPKSERYTFVNSTCVLPDSASHTFATAMAVEARQVDSMIVAIMQRANTSDEDVVEEINDMRDDMISVRREIVTKSLCVQTTVFEDTENNNQTIYYVDQTIAMQRVLTDVMVRLVAQK